MADADVHFYFDPVCPFCWMTSKWLRTVADQRGLTVDWRFISLRLLNAHVDYDAQFPPEYEAGHTAGLRLLRVAARVRAEHGRAALGPLYRAMGEHVFEQAPVADDAADHGERGTRGFVLPILEEAGLPADLADALDDDAWDATIRAETDEALALTGKDVGTPILHFEPPQGVAFFGPVISRLPSDEEAGELWDHVIGLARFPGVRRAQAEPARAAAAARARGVDRRGRGQRGLARREPSPAQVTAVRRRALVGLAAAVTLGATVLAGCGAPAESPGVGAVGYLGAATGTQPPGGRPRHRDAPRRDAGSEPARRGGHRRRAGQPGDPALGAHRQRAAHLDARDAPRRVRVGPRRLDRTGHRSGGRDDGDQRDDPEEGRRGPRRDRAGVPARTARAGRGAQTGTSACRG